MSNPTTTLGKLWWLLKQLPTIKKELTPGTKSNGASVILRGRYYLAFVYDRDTGYHINWENLKK